MTINMNVETKNLIKILALATAFTVGVLAFARMYDALIMVLTGLFIAVALNPAVSFLSRFMPGKRRGPAIAIVVVGVVSVLFFLFASIIPPIAKETSSFVNSLPKTLDSGFYKSKRVQNVIVKYDLQDDLDSFGNAAKKKATSIGTNVLGSAGRVGTSLLTGLTVLVIAILGLTGGSKIINRFADILYKDSRTRKRHERVVAEMYAAVTGYVIGQVSVALIASLFALGALALLGVPYPLPLALIVFIFGLIPLIGNTLAAVIVVLTTVVLKDATTGLILLAYFVLYQQIENITLQPIVQGKTSNLPPLIIFVSVILGVALIGPIGGLVAIPIAGCLKVLLYDWAEHRDDLKHGDTPVKLAAKLKHRLTGQPRKA